MRNIVNIIGGGFAGAEAALTLASFGVEVHLFDDHSPLESLTYEKVISQTFLNELSALGAESELSNNLTILRQKTLQKLQINDKIKIFNEKVGEISLYEPTIIASGTNTASQLFNQISHIVGAHNCKRHSFSPLILEGKIEGIEDENYAYVSVPQESLSQIWAYLKQFKSVHESIENWAASGLQLLKAKAFKPVFVAGKIIPNCLKFNKQNKKFVLNNAQTFLNETQQAQLISFIPALKNATISSFVEAISCTRILPICVNNHLQCTRNENIYFAGAVLGFDGELEAIASGHLAAINLACKMFGLKEINYPNDTLCQKLCQRLFSSPHSSSQMYRVCDIIENVNSQKAESSLEKFKEEINARISWHNNLCSQKRW